MLKLGWEKPQIEVKILLTTTEKQILGDYDTVTMQNWKDPSHCHCRNCCKNCSKKLRRKVKLRAQNWRGHKYTTENMDNWLSAQNLKGKLHISQHRKTWFSKVYPTKRQKNISSDSELQNKCTQSFDIALFVTTTRLHKSVQSKRCAKWKHFFQKFTSGKFYHSKNWVNLLKKHDQWAQLQQLGQFYGSDQETLVDWYSALCAVLP